MIIERTAKEELEIEMFRTNGITIYVEDSYYKERELKTAKDISKILPAGKYFLFDLTRVYKISCEEEIFDIIQESCIADFEICEHENISLFIDEVIGQDTFVSDLTEYFDEIKNMTVKDFIDKLIVKHSGVLKEDDSIITLEKNI